MSKKEGIEWDTAKIRQANAILRAVNHKLRKRMMDLIHDHKEMTVTEIYVRLRLEQSIASQHLSIMRRAGIVIAERRGKNVWYSLDYENIENVKESIENFDVPDYRGERVQYRDSDDRERMRP